MRKFTLLFVLLAGLTMNAQSKIEGVVTYYFNQSQGDKPDLGAKAVLIEADKIYENFFNDYNKYKIASYNQKIISDAEFFKKEYQEQLSKTDGKKKYEDQNEKIRDKIRSYDTTIEKAKKELSDLNLNSKNDYENLSNSLFETILNIEDKYPSKTIDNTGKYMFDNIKEGTYYVLLKSKNRNFTSTVEIMGQIYVEKIDIQDNASKDVSYNFKIR